jgi:hypothetical protein
MEWKLFSNWEQVRIWHLVTGIYSRNQLLKLYIDHLIFEKYVENSEIRTQES